MYIDLSKTYPDRRIEAFINARNGDEWFDYLDAMGVRSAVGDAIAEAPVKWIGVLQDLHVNDGFRGKKLGTVLFQNAVEAMENHGVEIMILFADMEEENEFDLTTWYSSFGFERVDNDKAAPMMVKAAPELIAALRSINGIDTEPELGTAPRV